jgi:hypothetical protein
LGFSITTTTYIAEFSERIYLIYPQGERNRPAFFSAIAQAALGGA